MTTISQRTKLRVVKETEYSSTTVTMWNLVELVKFTDDTYLPLSNDTITSSKSIY